MCAVMLVPGGSFREAGYLAYVSRRAISRMAVPWGSFREAGYLVYVSRRAMSRMAGHRGSFALATTTMLFCMGGNFSMFPAQATRHTPNF